MARAALAARGAALVMAMLLAALVAVIATSLLWQQQLWAGEYERRRDQVQAQALAMAGVQWARQILFENAPPSATSLGQPWAYRLPATPIENGSIGGEIYDAQGRIDVNNLGVPGNTALSSRAAMQRLFAELSLPPALVDAVATWVSPEGTAGGGTTDAYYLAQSPPALAADAPVRRVAELLSVRGANVATIARLRPFVEALDAPTTVNVNTASPEVLEAAIAGLDAAGAAALVTSRTTTPFSNLGDFRGRLNRPDLAVDESTLSVSSDWFVVTIEARQADTVAHARALLKRSAVSGAWPSVIWQTVE